MIDPRLTQFFGLWFDSFGSQWLKVKDLLTRSTPPLLELILRYAPDPGDRHKISRRHVGRFLARLSRGPPISGWRMQSRRLSGQLAFALAEAVLDERVHASPASRPSGAARILIDRSTHPQDALTQALTQGRNAVLEAMCSGDARQVADAQEFLTEIEAAAKHYLGSYEVMTRVQKAWNR